MEVFLLLICLLSAGLPMEDPLQSTLGMAFASWEGPLVAAVSDQRPRGLVPAASASTGSPSWNPGGTCLLCDLGQVFNLSLCLISSPVKWGLL